MQIKNFVLFKNGKKLWIVIAIGLFIALSLIVYAIIQVAKNSNGISFNNLANILSQNELYDLTSYYSESSVTVISNKNRNTYNINEWYKKINNENEYFKFDILNNIDSSTTSYVFKDNTLKVKNTNQSSEFVLDNYSIRKNNILSFATFLALYSDSKNLNCKYVKIEENEDDNNITTKLIFNFSGNDYQSNEFYNKYKDILDGGIKISSIELILDKKNNIPKSLNAYDSKGKVWIDLDYKIFKTNEKFDDKIFDF